VPLNQTQLSNRDALGNKDNSDNQIQTFYNDLIRYIDWYTNQKN